MYLLGGIGRLMLAFSLEEAWYAIELLREWMRQGSKPMVRLGSTHFYVQSSVQMVFDDAHMLPDSL